jgi:hypothetical protein
MNVLENGLHSFKKAVTLLNKIEAIESIEYEFIMKDIILSLHHSIETLFKYIVKSINELLIYDDITEYCKKAIKENNKENIYNNKTITFMDTVYRYYGLRYRHVNPIVINSFININEYRNALIHYEISYKDKEVEHLTANLLSELYSIYSKELEGFEEYCMNNNIDTDIKIIKERYIEWYISILVNLCGKAYESMEKIKKLEENPEEISQAFETIKRFKRGKNEKVISLVSCPICEKESFFKKGVLIIGTKEYGYYGECKFCGLNIKKEEAKFIYDNAIENNLEEFDSTFDLKCSLFNIFKHRHREIKKLVKQDNIKFLKELVIKDSETIEFFVYNVLIEVLETYLYNYIEANKYLEDEVNQDGEVIVEELLNEDEEELINFIEGFLLLDNTLYDYLNKSQYKILYYGHGGLTEINLVYQIKLDKLLK